MEVRLLGGALGAELVGVKPQAASSAEIDAVYEALSSEMKAFLGGLTVRHDHESFIRGMTEKLGDKVSGPIAERLRAEYPLVVHPLVRTHPETGRKALLFGGEFMRQIIELSETESRGMLTFLATHIDQPIFHVRWRWTAGYLVIWDERSTVHRGLSDHFPRAREVRRCVIDGDRPV